MLSTEGEKMNATKEKAMKYETIDIVAEEQGLRELSYLGNIPLETIEGMVERYGRANAIIALLESRHQTGDVNEGLARNICESAREAGIRVTEYLSLAERYGYDNVVVIGNIVRDNGGRMDELLMLYKTHGVEKVVRALEDNEFNLEKAANALFRGKYSRKVLNFHKKMSHDSFANAAQ